MGGKDIEVKKGGRLHTARVRTRVKDDDEEEDENNKSKNESGSITATSMHEGVRRRDA